MLVNLGLVIVGVSLRGSGMTKVTDDDDGDMGGGEGLFKDSCDGAVKSIGVSGEMR